MFVLFGFVFVFVRIKNTILEGLDLHDIHNSEAVTKKKKTN